MAKYSCFFYKISQPSHTPYAMEGLKMAPRLVRFLPLRWPRRLGALAGAEGRPDATILPAGVRLLQHHAETGQDQGMVGPWTRWSCLLVMVIQSLYNCIYIYIYFYTHTHTCMYIYIYIYLQHMRIGWGIWMGMDWIAWRYLPEGW